MGGDSRECFPGIRTRRLAKLPRVTIDVFTQFSERLASRGRSVAIDTSQRRVTYDALRDASCRFATLLGLSGARSGDRVVSQVERSPESIALWLACLRAGLVYVPINPALTPAETGYYFEDCAPRIVVVDPAREATLPAIVCNGAAPLTLDASGNGTLVERSRALPPRFDAHPCQADDVALLLYTSGTTGKPKGAMLTHGNLASNVRSLSELWRFTADDVLVHVLPLSHIHGLVVALGCVLASGCTLRLLPRFDPAEVIRGFATATVFMGVPTHYARLHAEPSLDRQTCASMRLFVSGSAPLTPQAFAGFESRTGHRILERYGMTETVMIASNPYDGERVPGSVGYALPDVEVRVVDAAGAPLARGETGVLEVRGPNVCKGYWQAPEKTAAAFRDDGFFITGDIARIETDGRVWLEGRASDLIITGGYNVYPREIEDALLAIAGVSDAAVFGVPHPVWGEAVVAAICTQDPALDAATVTASLRSQLASYKLPKRVLRMDALPRNAMGKVQKQALRAQHAGLFTDTNPEQ
jgi:malonyl-CoA/methylmalonyl-CoA synthetase